MTQNCTFGINGDLISSCVRDNAACIPISVLP
jgi:hypothetical protein